MSAPKIIAQLIIIGSQIFGRAMMEAIKEARAASGKAAAGRVAGGAAAASSSAVTRKLNMTVEEAENILNVRKDAPLEEIVKKYQALFEANDPKSGGSFYLQSKVYRAKERLELELQERAQQLADEERRQR
ncbi:Pam16-domain-containing protein [Hyaloraphidium curvatum]|nr:Pam16-domain-containing protein [Hyaloraphidium curvatum]